MKRLLAIFICGPLGAAILLTLLWHWWAGPLLVMIAAISLSAYLRYLFNHL